MVGRKGVQDHKKNPRGRVKIDLDVPGLNIWIKIEEEGLN
jgi:hypothetical protein